MVKEEINLLKRNNIKHFNLNKDKDYHKVKYSLTYKVIGLTVGLSILLIFLIAYPLSLIMMQNQEETLATGLQRRVSVLMDSITNGTKVYLPTENTLELNLLTNQSYTLVEAENVTILNYLYDNSK